MTEARVSSSGSVAKLRWIGKFAGVLRAPVFFTALSTVLLGPVIEPVLAGIDAATYAAKVATIIEPVWRDSPPPTQVILISRESYEQRFSGRSPLPRAAATAWLSEVLEGKDCIGESCSPLLAVLDFDLSPTCPQGVVGPQCDPGQKQLDELLDRYSAAGNRIILPLPFVTGSSLRLQAQQEWVRDRCRAGRGNLDFAMPNLPTSPLGTHILPTTRHCNLRQQCMVPMHAPIYELASARWSQLTHEKGGGEGRIETICEAIEKPRSRNEINAMIAGIARQPELGHAPLRLTANSFDQIAIRNDRYVPPKDRAVALFIGGNYDGRDTFALTPVSEQKPGVLFHAAAFSELAVHEYWWTHLVESVAFHVVFDIAIGLLFGLCMDGLLEWRRHSSNSYAARRVADASLFAVPLLCCFLLVAFLYVLMSIVPGIWLSPWLVIIGMAMDSYRATIESSEEKPEIRTSIDRAAWAVSRTIEIVFGGGLALMIVFNTHSLMTIFNNN